MTIEAIEAVEPKESRWRTTFAYIVAGVLAVVLIYAVLR